MTFAGADLNLRCRKGRMLATTASKIELMSSIENTCTRRRGVNGQIQFPPTNCVPSSDQVGSDPTQTRWS